MGTSFPGPDGRLASGVGLLDIETVRGPGRRAVGELVADPIGGTGVRTTAGAVGLERFTGFENHAGVTRLGPSAEPWARVIAGHGNGAGSGTDGARAGKVIGTYLHGPVLARNPTLADMLLGLATGTVPGTLDDEEEEALHGERLDAWAGGQRSSGPGGRSGWRQLVTSRRS
jgi:CobQ-like glutamine amidotransferase family enzyme